MRKVIAIAFGTGVMSALIVASIVATQKKRKNDADTISLPKPISTVTRTDKFTSDFIS